MDIPLPLILFAVGLVIFGVALLAIPNPNKKHLEQEALEFFERENRKHQADNH